MRHLLLIKNNLKRSVVTAITLIFLVGVAMFTILVSINSIYGRGFQMAKSQQMI